MTCNDQVALITATGALRLKFQFFMDHNLPDAAEELRPSYEAICRMIGWDVTDYPIETPAAWRANWPKAK